MDFLSRFLRYCTLDWFHDSGSFGLMFLRNTKLIISAIVGFSSTSFWNGNWYAQTSICPEVSVEHVHRVSFGRSYKLSRKRFSFTIALPFISFTSQIPKSWVVYMYNVDYFANLLFQMFSKLKYMINYWYCKLARTLDEGSLEEFPSLISLTTGTKWNRCKSAQDLKSSQIPASQHKYPKIRKTFQVSTCPQKFAKPCKSTQVPKVRKALQVSTKSCKPAQVLQVSTKLCKPAQGPTSQPRPCKPTQSPASQHKALQASTKPCKPAQSPSSQHKALQASTKPCKPAQSPASQHKALQASTRPCKPAQSPASQHKVLQASTKPCKPA